MWAEQDPEPADWSALCAILRAVQAPPLGPCDFDGELDVWTVRVAPGPVLPERDLAAVS